MELHTCVYIHIYIYICAYIYMCSIDIDRCVYIHTNTYTSISVALLFYKSAKILKSASTSSEVPEEGGAEVISRLAWGCGCRNSVTQRVSKDTHIHTHMCT